MKQLPTFDVLAEINEKGIAQRVNTLTRKTFHSIDRLYAEANAHTDREGVISDMRIRWLVVRLTGASDLRVCDLYEAEIGHVFPYAEAFLVPETFTTVDQAIGWVALTLC